MSIVAATDLKSESDTVRFSHLLSPLMRAGDMIALVGDLGAGKSTFARAFIRQAMQQPDLIIPSPTFTILQSYSNDKSKFCHADLYRLNDMEELATIGWAEWTQESVTLVEWPEKIPDALSPDALVIKLQTTEQAERRKLQFKWRDENRFHHLVDLLGNAGWPIKLTDE